MAIAPQTSGSAPRTVIGPGGGVTSFRSPSRAAARPVLAPRVAPAQAVPDREFDRKTAPYALWVLRLALGALFLQHVMQAVFGYVPADTSQLFGLPPGVSPLALGWDALIGLTIVYGVWPRLGALAGAVTLSLAALTSHGAGASEFAWQHPLLWVVALLSLALAGDGAFTLVPSRIPKEALR